MDKLYVVFSRDSSLQGKDSLLYMGPDLEKAKTYMESDCREMYVYQSGQLHSCRTLALNKDLKSA